MTARRAPRVAQLLEDDLDHEQLERRLGRRGGGRGRGAARPRAFVPPCTTSTAPPSSPRSAGAAPPPPRSAGAAPPPPAAGAAVPAAAEQCASTADTSRPTRRARSRARWLGVEEERAVRPHDRLEAAEHHERRALARQDRGGHAERGERLGEERAAVRRRRRRARRAATPFSPVRRRRLLLRGERRRPERLAQPELHEVARVRARGAGRSSIEIDVARTAPSRSRRSAGYACPPKSRHAPPVERRAGPRRRTPRPRAAGSTPARSDIVFCASGRRIPPGDLLERDAVRPVGRFGGTTALE